MITIPVLPVLMLPSTWPTTVRPVNPVLDAQLVLPQLEFAHPAMLDSSLKTLPLVPPVPTTPSRLEEPKPLALPVTQVVLLAPTLMASA